MFLTFTDVFRLVFLLFSFSFFFFHIKRTNADDTAIISDGDVMTETSLYFSVAIQSCSPSRIHLKPRFGLLDLMEGHVVPYIYETVTHCYESCMKHSSLHI